MLSISKSSGFTISEMGGFFNAWEGEDCSNSLEIKEVFQESPVDNKPYIPYKIFIVCSQCNQNILCIADGSMYVICQVNVRKLIFWLHPLAKSEFLLLHFLIFSRRF